MIEADLAEFIDQDCGIGELRCCKKPLQQRGLPTAEKTGDHVYRNGRCLFWHHYLNLCAGFSSFARSPKDRAGRTLCPEYAPPLARLEPDYRQCRFGRCGYSTEILRLPS